MINTKLFKLFIVISVFLTMQIWSMSVLAEIVVVVNSSNSTTSMKSSDLRRIFLGKADSFKNGGKAVAVYQITASDSRKTFDKSFLGKTSAQMNSYWSRQMFSGNGVPPKELSGDLAVLQYISGETTAIGYIDSSAVNESVKIVTILD